jgi:DNA repair protein RadC
MQAILNFALKRAAMQDMSKIQGHRSRLRARFQATGFDGFSGHETLELLLTLAIPRRDVKVQARELVARFGGLRGVLDAPAEELATVRGLGKVAPVALKIIREAATLYLMQQAEERDQFLTFESLERYWRLRLGGLMHEEFHVAYLDSSQKMLRGGAEALETGIPSQAMVYPRKVMQSALRRGAAALVFAHNHPSGDALPSPQDRELTRALQAAAQTLQIRVLDHLILTADKAFSFRREGLL